MLNFLMLVSIAVASKCLPYQCAPEDYKMPEGYCANSYNNTFFLKPCQNSENCDLTTGKCYTPQAIIESFAYPGESCKINSDCLMQNCSQGICQGYEQGHSCIEHENCSPGLRCYQNICIRQIDMTESGCIDDHDCINSAGCNISPGNIEGTCLGYLTVSIGIDVSDCSGGVSYLCKTGECLKSTKFGNYGTCKTSTTSVNSIPVICNDFTICTGTDGVYSYTGYCECGYNVNGASYCSLFNGDLPGQTYYNTWQKALVASNGVCNTVRRFSTACLKQTENYNKVILSTWGFVMYPQMQNNDACVIEMITYDGYEISFSMWLSIIGISLISL